jgi:hypothetical protein
VVDALQPKETPQWKLDEARMLADRYGAELHSSYKVVPGSVKMNEDNLVEQYLDNVWRPNLSITGVAGFPTLEKAGNVVRKSTTARLSLRLCPVQDGKAIKD